jgi:cyclopropane fatty-acyl-phospholipid synthase-like methyltransferase
MSNEKSVFLALKDYSVSGENFELIYNSEFEMLETFPKPSLEKLPSYYESEDYISHTDAKKSFTDKLYQFVKGYALKRKLRLINSFETDAKTLLDVGCGTGDFLLTCKTNGWNVVGVEPNAKAQKITKDKLQTKTVFKDVNEINSKQFDVITLWHVLEHVPNLDEYILKLKSLLKPNGVLVIAVPNYKSFDAKHYQSFWAAYDVPRHLWHFSQKSIQLLFSNVNFKLVKVLPMYFDSFYVSLLSEKYKTGTTNFIKAFIVGLKSNLKAIKTKEYSSLIYILKRNVK